jgi:hypothetical protein
MQGRGAIEDGRVEVWLWRGAVLPSTTSHPSLRMTSAWWRGARARARGLRLHAPSQKQITNMDDKEAFS